MSESEIEVVDVQWFLDALREDVGRAFLKYGGASPCWFMLVGPGAEVGRQQIGEFEVDELAACEHQPPCATCARVIVFATAFRGPEDKRDKGARIRLLTSLLEPLAVAFSSEAWAAMVPREEAETNKTPPSEREDRYEILMIHGTAGGLTVMSQAKVNRDPLSLDAWSEWQQVEVGDALRLGDGAARC